MKKRLFSGLMALSLLAGVLGMGGSSSEAASSVKFKDVPATHWASEAINAAVEQGYLKGYTDGTFKPSSPVTKAEMASILGRLRDQPNSAIHQTNTFTDIPAWAKDGVDSAIQKGFIDPSDYKGKLDAGASLKRGEMAVWLTQGLATVDADYKQALSDVSNTVVPAKEYFTGKLAASEKNAVAVAMGTGLMSVANDKMFGTDRTTTRAEVAVLIERYSSVAKAKPSDFKGLNELRQVGLTGTNLSIIAPSYKKTPESKVSPTVDYSMVTDDFSKVRNKEIVTRTNYADLKIRNWIVVSPYAKKDDRSIYYPVFVDEGTTPNRGSYHSYAELELRIKDKMTQLQAGSLIESPTINALISPFTQSFAEYSVPKIGDFVNSKGEFNVKESVYWSKGLLHFDKELVTQVSLLSKEGTLYDVSVN